MPPEGRRKGFVVAPEGYRRCKRCGNDTEIRVRKLDGARFIGCREYPLCRWTRELPRDYSGSRFDSSRAGPEDQYSELSERLKLLEIKLTDSTLGKVQRLRIEDAIEDLRRKLD